MRNRCVLSCVVYHAQQTGDPAGYQAASVVQWRSSFEGELIVIVPLFLSSKRADCVPTRNGDTPSRDVKRKKEDEADKMAQQAAEAAEAERKAAARIAANKRAAIKAKPLPRKSAHQRPAPLRPLSPTKARAPRPASRRQSHSHLPPAQPDQPNGNGDGVAATNPPRSRRPSTGPVRAVALPGVAQAHSRRNSNSVPANPSLAQPNGAPSPTAAGGQQQLPRRRKHRSISARRRQGQQAAHHPNSRCARRLRRMRRVARTHRSRPRAPAHRPCGRTPPTRLTRARRLRQARAARRRLIAALRPDLLALALEPTATPTTMRLRPRRSICARSPSRAL